MIFDSQYVTFTQVFSTVSALKRFLITDKQIILPEISAKSDLFEQKFAAKLFIFRREIRTLCRR